MVSLRFEKIAYRKGYKLICGIDEAGRGPLAGPVVAGAVILRSFKFNQRIDDSKKLSAYLREKAFGELLKKSFIGIGIVDHKQIDKLNILNATKLAMELALKNLYPRPDYLLIDGTFSIKTSLSFKTVIDGDAKSLSIAGASIVAKVIRDRIMSFYDRLYPEYGFIRHKGYATPEHINAIFRYGPSPIHRLRFQPLRSLICTA